VDQACGTDRELRQQVEALLAEAHHPAPLPIDGPVGAVIADLLADNGAVVVGTQLGPYRIESLLGAGGMGEVYRATDPRLGRQVAIKVLPPTFAADPQRVARFRREAQILASLNHPNIGAIYGVERIDETDSQTLGLVLELVEGPTLADTLAARPLSVDDALAFARQIAAALEAAHEQGIVHRDLKPGNIKIRDDGTVKVLDFGLAKAGEEGGPSDTATRGGPDTTVAGAILGTAAYMSPEQASGKPVDRRSDIWSFGCVIYEMLTGTRAFAGDDVAQVLASILAREPDWTRLPSRLPPGLAAHVRRCLHKNPKQRIGDVQDVRLALDGAFENGVSSPAVLTRSRALRRFAAPIAGGLVVAWLASAVMWLTRRTDDAVPPRVSRLQIIPPESAALTVNADFRSLAITPDGTRVVYVGDAGRQLFMRPLDALEPTSVYTGAPRGPFISPDGQWIGFVDNRELRKIPIGGGVAATLATLDAPTYRGAAWGPDDAIVFATTNPQTGLQRVSAQGGPITILTRPDHARGEADHVWPEWLPDGRGALFTITSVAGGLERAQLGALNLTTGARTVLPGGGAPVHYVSTGHLVYATRGTLWALPFDPARPEAPSTPVAVVRDVVTSDSGVVDAVVAANGTLAYVAGGAITQSTRTLVWVDRQGRETAISVPPRAYVHPRLSPDGTRVAVFVADQELDLWMSDLKLATLSRLTSGGGVDTYPEWTPDSRHLIFSSQRAGPLNLFRQQSDADGAAERLTVSVNSQDATSVTPDGRTLIFTEMTPDTGEDVMQMRLDGTRAITPLVRTPFAERNGVVSRDGRWLAYEANDSGRFEVFVRPFPNIGGGRWPLSSTGGTRPLWSRDGREVLYVAPTGAIMRVGISTGPSWAATTPTLLVKEGYATLSANPGRTYDISADGQRLLLIKPAAATAPSSHRAIVVVLNWAEELKRLSLTK
ncbi:MAG: protein kinase, partial [Acidobacteriota bacterium]